MIRLNNPNKFLPWNPTARERDFSVNKFDFNQPLPGTNPVNLPILGPRVNTPPPDFAGQYAKITGNRPNKLAYQQAVEQGAPEIQRSNWARLGAVLAGVGSNLGGESPRNATALGMSAYMEPQRRSDEAYEKRVTGLGNLANIEESDLDRQIRGLESQQENYFRGENLKNDSRRLQLDESETQAQNQLTQLQMNQIRKKMYDDDIYEYTDPQSGITFRKMPDGSIQQLAKTKLTPKEEAEAEGLTTSAKEAAQEPFRKAGDLRQRGTTLEAARIGAQSRENVAETNRVARKEAVAAKLNAVGKQLKPGEAATQVWNDLTGAVNSEEVFSGMGSPEAYLDITGLGTSNAVIKVKPDSMWDSADDKLIKDRLRQVISGSYTRSNSGGSGRGSSNLPPGWSQ